MNSAARTALVGLLVVLAAAPLSAQATSTVDRPQFIRVIAKDYVYDAPASVQSGIATIHLINQGVDIHHVTVQELPGARTPKEFFEAARTTGRPPSWSRGTASPIVRGARRSLRQISEHFGKVRLEAALEPRQLRSTVGV